MKSNKKLVLFFLILISLIEFIVLYNIYFIVIYIISFMSSLLITNNLLISILIGIILANIYYIITSLIEPLDPDEKLENISNNLKWRELNCDKNMSMSECARRREDFIKSIFDSAGLKA